MNIPRQRFIPTGKPSAQELRTAAYVLRFIWSGSAELPWWKRIGSDRAEILRKASILDAWADAMEKQDAP